MMRALLLLISCLFVTSMIAQGPMRNWHFGWSTSTDMLAGPPSFESGSIMLANESSVSVSNEAGDLLFYSEGIQVYNANDAIMPNGTGLLCNSFDFQQGVATCPWPGDPNKHLLFHTGLDQILRVSTVDMSLDGGLGDVTLKNIVISPNIGEAMTIAPHANGVDYWLVVRDFPADLYKVYAITSAGVGPVVSSVACGMDTFDFTGMARFNHRHDRMAVTMRGVFGNMGKIGLFPFDPATGQLSTGTVVPSYAPWGLEFSCTDRFLFLSHNDLVPIQQFNMTAGNALNILSAPIDVSEPIIAFDMTNAPDNRIYFVWNDPLDRGARSLGAIRQPDALGPASNVTDSAVVWTNPSSRATTGLPNFMQTQTLSNGSCSMMATSIIELDSSDLSVSSTVVQEGMWVRWPSRKSGFEVDVVNSAGGIVQRLNLNSNEAWLNSSALASGVYVLRCRSLDDQRVESIRFLKE